MRVLLSLKRRPCILRLKQMATTPNNVSSSVLNLLLLSWPVMLHWFSPGRRALRYLVLSHLLKLQNQKPKLVHLQILKTPAFFQRRNLWNCSYLGERALVLDTRKSGAWAPRWAQKTSPVVAATELGCSVNTVHLQPRNLSGSGVNQIPGVVLSSKRRRGRRGHLGRRTRRASVVRPAADSAQRRLRRPGHDPLNQHSTQKSQLGLPNNQKFLYFLLY